MGPTTENVVWKRLKWGRITPVRPAATHVARKTTKKMEGEGELSWEGQRENWAGLCDGKDGFVSCRQAWT